MAGHDRAGEDKGRKNDPVKAWGVTPKTAPTGAIMIWQISPGIIRVMPPNRLLRTAPSPDVPMGRMLLRGDVVARLGLT